MTLDLKIFDMEPCAWCKSTKLTLDCKSKNGYKIINRTYSVRCNKCHARGPSCGGSVLAREYYDMTGISCKLSTDDQLQIGAIQRWNNRK